VLLPNVTSRKFWLNGSAWEYPTFENAEVFVKRLVHAGVIAEDPLVKAVLRGHRPDLTTRTEQRRFLQVTGMTREAIHQIERARYAVNLLQRGVSILEAAHEAGYYDQAHFTRSLNRWIGQTPAQVIRAEQQLSYLYNTQPPRIARV
jgi:methylphosphotriester-DNA--protein-cysteine methyltransferase